MKVKFINSADDVLFERDLDVLPAPKTFLQFEGMSDKFDPRDIYSVTEVRWIIRPDSGTHVVIRIYKWWP